MQDQTIDLGAAVQALREKSAATARSAFEDCFAWIVGPAQGLAVHDVERDLRPRLMDLGCALVALWIAMKLPMTVPRTLRPIGSWYRFRKMSADVVRSRFGDVEVPRPLYERVSGGGHATLAPFDREIGLAAGRMTLGVHLLAGYLAAKVVFDEVVDVIGQFGEYVPSKRAILGIVDRLGPVASAMLANMPVPDGDGEILVIQSDDKGAPMIGKREHARRCKPHKKRKRQAARAARRTNRREHPRARRPKGAKSKNARMAKVVVIYTLKRCGKTLEGPINKRVIATFKSRSHAFEMALTEARKRGYGRKPTYFLADGSKAIWSMQQRYFPLATACVDWYHVCEYLWKAGGTVLGEGSPALAAWVHDRKAELRAGRLDALLASMRTLRQDIPNGKRNDGRRKRLAQAIGYIDGHRERLRYRELAAMDMDIATGAVEGAVNHVVGQRLDGSMMRWSLSRAEHVVALRCIVVNDLWDHFADTVAIDHSRCRDPHVPRITPERPQVPYDAVRKAA